MNLLFRLLAIVLRARHYRAGDFAPHETARLVFRVLPTDLDFNLHMNNARYLSLMDLGRVDLLNRLGLLRLAFRGRWLPVLGAVSIRYQRPLQLWNRYELLTRIVGWDEKWFYLEQRFERVGKIVATAHVKALVRGPTGSLPTVQVLDALHHRDPSPSLPPEVLRLPE
ncbi:MAG TPA: thioesterase family protein [Gemmatimonadales bacterium]|jgi:acyl-CoA thioesterase FadM